MKVKDIPIKDLREYDNNPRNNDGAVEAVKRSIADFGFCRPIVIDQDKTIVCGHTRLRALRELGQTKVPCVVIDDLTPEQVTAFRLADNKVAEAATWDIEKLDTELAGLDIDMEPYGFITPDIDTEDSGDDYTYECPECGYRFN